MSEAEKEAWTKEKAAHGINREYLWVKEPSQVGQDSEGTGGTGSLGAKHWDKLADELRNNQDGRGWERGGKEPGRKT